MIIAAYAVGAERIHICSLQSILFPCRLRLAISQAEKYGLLGENIMAAVNFHLHINRGAGAFVCSEGSALTSSIEETEVCLVSQSRLMLLKGLWGKPAVKCVETYADVPGIIIQGAVVHTIRSEEAREPRPSPDRSN